MDTIWMITLKHEFESGNGYWEEIYVDEDQGFFTTWESAERRLAELREKEASAHRSRWERDSYGPWERRQEKIQNAQEANEALRKANLPGLMLEVPYNYPEPIYGGWKSSFSGYDIIEVKAG